MALLIQELEWGLKNNMNNNSINNDNSNLKKEDFEFIQIDKRIHDTKFETKPTTFAKDAFKRFTKNKSSVVGAIIIGFLLLCSFIVPLVSPYDIKSVHADQSLLVPKLFNAGTGFWDGTKKYSNIAYDGSTDAPIGFKKEAVISSTIDEITYIDQPYLYAEGGYLNVFKDDIIGENENPLDNLAFLYNYTDFKITNNENYTLQVNMDDTDDINGGKLGEYRIQIQYRLNNKNEFLLVKDWSKDYSDYTINLSEVLLNNGIEEVEKAKIRFDIKPVVGYKTYILIQTLELNCDSSDEEIQEVLEEISFLDANACALLSKGDNNQFPVGYWQSNANKDVYHAEMRKVSFVYDEYAAVFGSKNMNIGGSYLKTYIENGWCEYDFNIGIDSFKILDAEKCPIEEVYSQSYDSEYDIYTVNAKVVYYKYLGYDKMPRYLLGTTNDGKDLVKLAFSSLKTSLLIAIIASFICLFIGLIWGSISGYFGGNVDIVMERFCEILSGVPWIVVMTLTILLLGNNIFTFALALCLTGWIGVAGRTRTQFYRFKGREYVLASRTLGSKDTRLIFRHILPNALGTIVTSSVLMIPSVIFSEATLAYLNLGLQGVDSFGVLLSENQQHLSTYPALIVFPAIIISLLMISFNLFGNGLRDALNPSLKGSD